MTNIVDMTNDELGELLLYCINKTYPELKLVNSNCTFVKNDQLAALCVLVDKANKYDSSFFGKLIRKIEKRTRSFRIKHFTKKRDKLISDADSLDMHLYISGTNENRLRKRTVSIDT